MNNSDVRRKGRSHGDSYFITWQNNYRSYSITLHRDQWSSVT